MSENAKTWLSIVGSLMLYFLLLYFLFLQRRGWSRKAGVERRLLVWEDGQYVWRSVKGRMLVGSSEANGEVNWGGFGREDDRDREIWDGTWAVIETKQKLIVYRFHKRVGDDPQTGTIQICNSWRELETAVPANIFEAALTAAGIKKPNEYRVSKLEL